MIAPFVTVTGPASEVHPNGDRCSDLGQLVPSQLH